MAAVVHPTMAFSPDYTREADAIDGLRRGDHAALGYLVEAHQAAVLRLCRRYTGSAAAAADITQDVFVALWDARDRYRDAGRLGAWLFGVARNLCLRHLERHGRFVPLTEDARRAPERTDAGILARQLEAKLALLSTEHADVLVLRFLEELSLAEIAELSGVALGTVKSRLHRAMAELRRHWDGD